jgi:hypothetical protein
VLGSLLVTRAAWPTMVQRGYGRVILTTSIGMLGGPFLISYSTAKGGVMSLGRSLALAGREHGIRVNLLAPAAETRMVTDREFRAKANLPLLEPAQIADPARGPDQVTPMLLVLAHDSCPCNGEILIAGLGRYARIFLAETRGITDRGAGPEDVLERWNEIVDEAGYVIQASTADSVAYREATIRRALG